MLPLWLMILQWLLPVVIVTGNGMVIYLITTKRNLRTTTNWFVLSLAVADFGVGACTVLFYFLCLIHQSCDIKVKGVDEYFIKVFFIHASVTNLCALTLDRYLAIVKPLRYVTFMTKKRVALLAFVAWSITSLQLLVSCLVMSFAASGNTQEIMESTIRLCAAVLSFAACVFLSFTTARIFLVIRRIAKQNAAMVAQLNFNHKIQHRAAFKARETASAKMVGIVVTIFVICFSLHIVAAIYFYIWLSDDKTLFLMKKLLTLLNSAVNPVAYAFHKTEIKRELKRLFRCNRQQVLHNNSVTRGEHREQYRLRLREHRVEQQPGS